MGLKRPYAGRMRPVDREVEVRPASPYRLPRGSDDRTLRVEGGVATRLLHIEGSPVVVRAWQLAPDRVVLRAQPVEPGAVALPVPGAGGAAAPAARAGPEPAVPPARVAPAVGYPPRHIPPRVPPRPPSA